MKLIVAAFLSMIPLAAQAQAARDATIERLAATIDTQDVGRLTSILNQFQNIENQASNEAVEIDDGLSVTKNVLQLVEALDVPVVEPINALSFYAPVSGDENRYIAENKPRILQALQEIDERMARDVSRFQERLRDVQAKIGGPASSLFFAEDTPAWRRELNDVLRDQLIKEQVVCPAGELRRHINSPERPAELSRINFMFSDVNESLISCRQFASQTVDLRSIKSGLVSAISALAQKLSESRSAVENQITRIIDLKSRVQINISRLSSTSDKLIQFALPSIVVMIIAMLFLPRFYSSGIQQRIFSGNMLLEVLTVFLLIAAVLILGIADKIANDSLGTLLGGVSGYVLGKASSYRNADS